MRRFPAPNPIHGGGLKYELAQAGYTEVSGALVGDEVEISAKTALGTEPTEADWTAIGTVVAAHTGAPDPESAAEADARQKARAAYKRLGELLAIPRDVRAQADRDEFDEISANVIRYVLRSFI